MAAPWEKYASAPEASDGPWARYSTPKADEVVPEESGGIGQTIGNLAAGAVRGAGSIGATLLTPIDAAARAVGVQNDYIGRTDRRQAMDAGLQQMGAQPDSLAYKGGKLAGEIAGTAGAGGVIAKGVSAIPGAAAAAPGFINALRTSGMQAGSGNALANLAPRMAGGAISGGVTAGLVNPEDAAVGAGLGAALPPALMISGKIGGTIGRAIRGPEQSEQMKRALGMAKELGLVVPPTQAKASLGNRLLEGTAGKLTTAQNAGAANAPRVNEIIARDLGLPAGTELNAESIGYVKKAAGALYDAVGNAGTVKPGPGYSQALDKIVEPHMRAAAGFPNAKQSPVVAMVDSLRSEAFDAASAVAKIKELRSAADDAFKPGGQGADIGRAAKAAAKALENTLDDHLKAIGEPELLGQFRSARAMYAKASTADKVIDQATGTIDARKLAAELQKKKPLSGDMRKVAEVAAQFKTAFKTPEQMGSLPQFSPLDLYGGAGIAGISGALTGNPLSALGLALPLVRAGARSAALSPRVQNRLLQGSNPNRLAELLASQDAAQLVYRGAPVIAADR